MKALKAFFALAVAASIIGCNAGMAPEGMTEQDAKSAIENMKPEDKIRAIAGSPMPQAEKDKKYAEIEQQSGVKAADVLGGNNATGQPGSGGK
jgi:hypothetical protein